jgi:hypothetical protein
MSSTVAVTVLVDVPLAVIVAGKSVVMLIWVAGRPQLPRARGPDLMTGRGCAKQKWGTIDPPGDCPADALEPASEAASPAEASDARTRKRPANARHAATSRRPRGRFVPERIRGRISAVRTQIAAFLRT